MKSGWNFLGSLLRLAALVLLLTSFALASEIELAVRKRNSDGSDVREEVLRLDPTKVAIVQVDLWNSHPDSNVRWRGTAMIPRLNQVNAAARDLGMTVIHGWAHVPMPTGNGDANDQYSTARTNTVATPTVPLPMPPGVTDTGGVFVWTSGSNADWLNQLWPFTSYPSVPGGGNAPAPGFPSFSGAHPDISVTAQDFILNAINEPGPAQNGWGSPQQRELNNVLADRSITHVIYTGTALNLSVYAKTFAILGAKRLGAEVLLATDLLETVASNNTNNTYDTYHKQLTPIVEQTMAAGSFNSSQILAARDREAGDRQRGYTTTIAADPNLLSYWRMDGKNGYWTIQDVMRTQQAWNGQNASLGVAGAIAGDVDTAVALNGTQAILISPQHQNRLPNGSPLLSLSSGSFSVEAWVQVDALTGVAQSVFSHDDGNEATVDFLLELDAGSQWRFRTRGTANSVSAATPVADDDVSSNRWYHVVGTQDTATGQVALYVDGELAAHTNLAGTATNIISSLQIGSRGATSLNAGGNVVDAGSSFFTGAIDEPAIYAAALDPATIKQHFLLGTGGPVLKMNVDRRTGAISIVNDSADAVGLTGYAIVSAAGALDPDSWDPLADSLGGSWAESAAGANLIAESGSLFDALRVAPGTSLELGDIYFSSPFEDVTFTYSLADGSSVRGLIAYDGIHVGLGDFDCSSTIDAADWAVFVQNFGRNLVAATVPEAHQLGDMNGDLHVDLDDFQLFQARYLAANPGAMPPNFAVPEPSGFLTFLVTVGCVGRRRISALTRTGAKLRQSRRHLANDPRRRTCVKSVNPRS